MPFFVQLTKLAIFKMNYLAKFYVAKFIRDFKMCDWFIWGNCTNVAKNIFLKVGKEITDALKTQVP